MKADASSTLGAMISIVAPESCIGCNECELSCPDFAIYVAEKSEFKFAKLSDAAKARQEAISNNGYRLPADYKEAN
jgi:2-oxoglutarate ferredoxin oxidoreductase subunit delta